MLKQRQTKISSLKLRCSMQRLLVAVLAACASGQQSSLAEQCPAVAEGQQTLKVPNVAAQCSCSINPKIDEPIYNITSVPHQFIFLIDKSDSIEAHEYRQFKDWIHGTIVNLKREQALLNNRESENFLMIIQFSTGTIVEYATKIDTPEFDNSFKTKLLNLKQDHTSTNLFQSLTFLSHLLDHDSQVDYETMKNDAKFRAFETNGDVINRDLWNESNRKSCSATNDAEGCTRRSLFILSDGMPSDSFDQANQEFYHYDNCGYNSSISDRCDLQDHLDHVFDRRDVIVVSSNSKIQSRTQREDIRRLHSSNGFYSSISSLNEISTLNYDLDMSQRSCDKKCEYEVIVALEKSMCFCETYAEGFRAFVALKKFANVLAKRTWREFTRSYQNSVFKLKFVEFYNEPKKFSQNQAEKDFFNQKMAGRDFQNMTKYLETADGYRACQQKIKDITDPIDQDDLSTQRDALSAWQFTPQDLSHSSYFTCPTNLETVTESLSEQFTCESTSDSRCKKILIIATEGSAQSDSGDKYVWSHVKRSLKAKNITSYSALNYQILHDFPFPYQMFLVMFYSKGP